MKPAPKEASKTMKLTLNKSDALDDWYLIERAEHDGRSWLERVDKCAMALMCSSRFSDADVEGGAEEMRAIASAIESRGEVSFKRCAVDATQDPVRFWSPRNSQRDGEVSYEEAAALAAEIREQLQ